MIHKIVYALQSTVVPVFLSGLSLHNSARYNYTQVRQYINCLFFNYDNRVHYAGVNSAIIEVSSRLLEL